MALVGIELVTHVSEPDALTTRPPSSDTYEGRSAQWNEIESDALYIAVSVIDARFDRTRERPVYALEPNLLLYSSHCVSDCLNSASTKLCINKSMECLRDILPALPNIFVGYNETKFFSDANKPHMYLRNISILL